MHHVALPETEYKVEFGLVHQKWEKKQGHGAAWTYNDRTDLSTPFNIKYKGADPVSREWMLGAFEDVMAALQKTKECTVCTQLSCDTICGTCGDCYINARVKRARL